MVDASLTTTKILLSCRSCTKQFGRLEHLKRHELSHDVPRFQCALCSKTFARKDGLDRHELIHQSATSLVQKRARACLACAVAKARCSGERPTCHRCSKTHRDCTYPSSDEQPLGDANNQQSDNAQSPQESYPTAVQPRISLSDSAVHLSNPGAVVGLGSQPLGISDNSSGMEGYLNNWDGSMSNINWLSLNSVDLDLSDPIIHFPFQQVTNTNVVDSSRSDSVDVGNASWHTNFPRTATGTASPGIAEQIPHHTVSASPSNALSHMDESSLSLSPTQTATSGEYYVDGNGARLPRVKRRRLTSTAYSKPTTSPGLNLKCSPSLITCGASTHQIGLDQYSYIQDLYQRLCLMSNFFRPFVGSELLPREALSNLLDSFITNVHPWLPFMHIPTLDLSKLDTTLIIAMAALGARNPEIEDGEVLSAALLEFLRRIFLSYDETCDPVSPPSESLIQAQLWYVVGARYSGVPTLRKSADEVLKRVMPECLTVSNQETFLINDISDDTQWRSWAEAEERKRTRLSIWLLDSIIAAEDRTAPTVDLSAISHFSLPCHDAIWLANSVASVLEAGARFRSNPNVSSAMQELYMSKKLPTDLGEFAQLVIIHGVIKRTWEMRLHLQHDLAGFEPTADKQISTNNEILNGNRRRSSEAYQRWRNAACDCLDILHWRANAMIGAASGMEHSGVLHLHFARVVLLSPIQEIVALAKHLSRLGSADISSDDASLQARQQPIRQWVVEDPYKARLAAIHAGVLFWHIRRYSSNAFYEPGAVAQSSLMLWALSAFSNYNNNTDREQIDQHHSMIITEPPSMDTCDIILIDRPTDDVLVQQFVRQGQNMQAIMTGVGNLFGPAGSQRVLREGCKLISSLDSWRLHGQHWLHLLETLDIATSSSWAGKD